MNNFIELLKISNLYDYVFLILHITKTVGWFFAGKNTSTPHLVKQSTVKHYKKKYNPHIFIETGTYMGTMVNAIRGNFLKIYTIELDKKLYIRAKNKFKKFKHIKILWGDSGKILPKLLKSIKEPSLFWLDAHYEKGTTSKGLKETPVIEELNSILKHKIKNHVILIDDAEAFSGKNNYYPSQRFLKKYVSENYPNLLFNIKYNIIRITTK